MRLDEQIFATVPLWLLRILLFATFLLCCVLGAKLRTRFGRERAGGERDSYVLSAVLGLLGLMIAFTFSMALNRYDDRRELVVSEANAIGTAWLRAGLIEGTAGPQLQAAIARYAELRAHLPARGETRAVESASGEHQKQLWRQMRTAIAHTSPPVATLVIASMNEMFDIASSRKAEREAQIPALVLDIVMVYALLSAGIIGYVLGEAEPHHRMVTAILFLLLTLSLALVIDLDRPWRGSITISQQPMDDLRAMIASPR